MLGPARTGGQLSTGKLAGRVAWALTVLREAGGSRLSRLRGDRRGAIAVTFALGAVAFLGAAGLATEVGGWYLARRSAQNAADAAAWAGALALNTGGGKTGAVAAANYVATQNGFTTGSNSTTVTVNNPPASGPNSGNSSDVEAIVQQDQPLLISALFLTKKARVTVRAVAGAQSNGDACLLTLGGDLSMGGSSVTTGHNCTLASNATDATAIDIYGAAEVTAYSLSTVGGCTGCSGKSVTLQKPAKAYQQPATNPFTALDSLIAPPTGATATSVPNNATSLVPYETSGKYYSHDSIKLTGNSTLTVTPGTYYLDNTSLSVQSGSLVCSGCTNGAGVTFVLTGSSTIDINANATVNLSAPKNSANPALDGILFYQRGSGSDTINGGSSTFLAGAVYLPNAYVKFNGNTGNNPSTCTVLVANSADLSGNSGTYLDESGCSNYGTATPTTNRIALLE